MLTELEQADGVTLTPSGVAEITQTLMASATPGRHLLVADHVYGNTRNFCDTVLTRQGLEVGYYDPMTGANLPAFIRFETCAAMFETPGSGTFEVPGIPSIAQAAPTTLKSAKRLLRWATKPGRKKCFLLCGGYERSKCGWNI